MKICVLATSYPRSPTDRASTFVHGLANGIAECGHQVVAIVPHEKGLELDTTLDRVRLKRFRYFWPQELEQVAYGFGIPENLRHKFWAKIGLPFFVISFLVKAVRESRECDILHVHWEASALIAALIVRLRRPRVPIVFTVHRLITRSAGKRFFSRWLLRQMDMIHFNSTYTRDKARELLGSLPLYEIVYPSIDPEYFKPGSAESSFRKRFSIATQDPVILGLGRLIEKKGFAYLIQAFAGLRSKSNGGPLPRLIIAGGGPLLGELKRMAEQSCPPESVCFTDFVQPDEVRSLMQESQIMVVPSIEDSRGEIETLGIVSMEAMACGVPVIASRVGGIPDVVEDGVTGLLVPPKDPKALCTAMEKLLGDQVLTARLKETARKNVETKFSWVPAVKRTLDSYEVLLMRRD